MQLYWTPVEGDHGYANAGNATVTPDKREKAKGATPDKALNGGKPSKGKIRTEV
jgi:hypothetical protein